MIDSNDPYRAPHASLNASLNVGPSITPIEMPGSVKATVAIVFITAVMVGYGPIVQGQIPLTQVGVLSLVVWGILRRKALAWQWLRLGAVLGFIGFAGASAARLLAGQASGGSTASVVGNGISLLMSVIFLLPAFFLGTMQARRYFGVVCPICGSTKVKAGDFFYREKRCKACPSTWL